LHRRWLASLKFDQAVTRGSDSSARPTIGGGRLRFRVADYVLDVARRELLWGSEPVALELQVFDLLALLIRNRDRVVSKGQPVEGRNALLTGLRLNPHDPRIGGK
jgi:DNA-binding response OmpR family regulator